MQFKVIKKLVPMTHQLTQLKYCVKNEADTKVEFDPKSSNKYDIASAFQERAYSGYYNDKRFN